MAFKFKTNILPVTHTDTIFQWKQFMTDTTNGPGWKVVSSGTGVYDSSPASYIHWKLDEYAGNLFRNSGALGENNLAPSSSGTTSGVESLSGKGVRCNGGYLSTNVQTVNPENKFTVSFLVRVHELKASCLLYSGSSAANPNVEFYIVDTNGNWKVSYTVGGTKKDIIFDDPAERLSVNQDYLLSFTYNPATTGYTATAYLNAIVAGSNVSKKKFNAENSAFSWQSNSKWFVGSNYDNSSTCNATFSDIRVENIPRDDSYLNFVYLLHANSQLNWKLNEQANLGKFSSNGNAGDYTLSSNIESPEYYNAGHTATTLNDGNVLVVGGSSKDSYLLDAVDGIFSKTGSMSTTRSWHAATLLKGAYDGYVLVTGGESDGASGDAAHQSATTTAELYNPTTKTFSSVGQMAQARARHTATLITSGNYDGYVLIAGGCSSVACELYNPTTQTFISAGSMNTSRSSHTATSVGAKVLLVGGKSVANSLASTEVFDMATGAFQSASTPYLSVARVNHTATLLSDNSVLIVGGEDSSGNPVSAVEKCNSSVTSFSTLQDGGSNVSISRSYHSATLLSNNKVLIAGGVVNSANYSRSAVVLDPSLSSNLTSNLPDMNAPRANHQAIRLKDDHVVLIGGAQNGSNSEVFDIISSSFRPTNAFVQSGAQGIIGNSTSISPIEITKLYLPFNSSISDFSSSSLSLTQNGGVSLSSAQSKSSGKSCFFDGNDDYISFVPGFTLANVGWTIDTWIYPTSVSSTFSTIVSRSKTAPTASLDWAIQFNLSQIRFRTNNDNPSVVWANASNSNVTASYSFSANNWYHVVVKHDGNDLSIFVNDMSKPVAKETIAVTSFGGTSAAACVGCLNSDSPTEFFAGYIDNLRISVTDKSAPIFLAPTQKFVSFSNVDTDTALMVRFRNKAYSARANITSEAIPTNQSYPDVTDSYTKINWKMEEGFGERIIGYANVLKNRYEGDPWIKSSSDLTASEFVTTVRNNLAYARHSFTATRLANGKVLVVGGNDGSNTLATAEIYDPLSKTFSGAGSLNSARQNHTATLLNNGKVLVAGGKNGATALSTSEIYDPVADTFTLSASSVSPAARFDHTATLLNDGYALIAGGNTGSAALNDGYVYDPSADQYTSVGTFTGVRSLAAAAKLSDGKVLICGGSDSSGAAVSSTVLFDRSSVTPFTAHASMSSGRSGHTATLLPNGKVLVAGGVNASGTAISTVELYDSGTFGSSISMTEARTAHTATLLNDGYVLIAGGVDGSTYHATARVFNSANNSFSGQINMASGSAYGSSVLLVDSNVEGCALVLGGKSDASTVKDTAEIFTPSVSGGSFALSASAFNMDGSVITEDPEIVKLSTGSNSGKIFVTGGNNNGTLKSTSIYDPTTATVTNGPDMADKRVGHFAVGMSDGKVLVGGGYDSVSNSYPQSAEVYDPSSGSNGSFTSAPNTSSSRYLSASALMSSGRVMVSGGKTDSSVLNTVEVYNPGSVAGTSSLTPIDGYTNIEWKFDEASGQQFMADDGYGKNLSTLYSRDFPLFANSTLQSARAGATYTKLSNGKVLIAGGRQSSDINSGTVLNTADIFDPYTGIIMPAGNMTSARSRHSAALMSDGRVLLVGGVNGGANASAEIYDPISNTFSVTGSMITARIYEPACVGLNNGKVLVAGGNNGSYVNAAELYDPSTGTFTATGNLNVARDTIAAISLNNGNVLIVGGWNGGAISTHELYNTLTGTFSQITSSFTRIQASLSTLNDGRILISGGAQPNAQIFDPSNNSLSSTITMVQSRQGHSSVTLTDGKVLISSGLNTSTAEIFNPATNSFSSLQSMANVRYTHGLFLLPNGNAIAIGGGTNVTEIYNISTDTWSANTTNYKFGASITRENPEVVNVGSKILVTGGTNGSSGTSTSGYLATTEVYDPSAGSTSAGPSMSSARVGHIAAPLPNSQALIAGGTSDGTTYLSSAQIYDGTASLTDAGAMSSARYLAKSAILNDGSVLVAGGYAASGQSPLATAEVYKAPGFGQSNMTPTDGYTKANWKLEELTSSYTLTDNIAPGLPLTTNDYPVFANKTITTRYLHEQVTLLNGNVLIIGGNSSFGGGAAGILKTAEIFDPSTGVTRSTANMLASRGYSFGGGGLDNIKAFSATLLQDGRVLVAGGYDGSTYLSSAEIYDPNTETFSATGSMNQPRSSHTATILPNGKVLIVGGFNASSSGLTSAELYDPTSGTFSYTGSMVNGRSDHDATLIPTAGTSGKVLITGGKPSIPANAEIFDVSSGVFTSAGTMVTARAVHAVKLVVGGPYDGYALIVGGWNGGYLSSVELYNPSASVSSAFINTNKNLTSALCFPSLVSIGGGKMLVVNGDPNGSGSASSVVTNIIDLSSSTISVTAGPNTTTARRAARTNRISGGKYDGYVFISGQSTAPELYNPTSNTIIANSLSYQYGATYSIQNPETTKLSDGRIFITGGTNGSVQSANAIYDPSTNTVTTSGVPALSAAKIGHTITPTTSGKYLIAGGSSGSNGSTTYYNTAQVYTEASGGVGSIAATTGTLNENRYLAKAAKLTLNNTDGYVFIAGGHAGSNASNTAEIYNPNTGTFSYTSKSATYSPATTNIDSSTLYGWALDEAAGASTFANSASGSGSAITLSKGGTIAQITSGVSGISSNCVQFTGASNAWLYSSNTSVNPSPVSMTMSCWVKLTAYTNNAPIFYKSNQASNWADPYASFGFFQGSSGQWYIRFSINGTRVERTFSSNTIPLNTWTLLAATYDGNYIKTYYNGTLIETYAALGNISYAEAAPYVIGGQHTGGGSGTAGYIDDVRVDNTVRSAKYIQDLYLNGTSSLVSGSVNTNPDQYTAVNWQLDEQSPLTTFANSTGTTVNLTKVGNVTSGVSGISGSAALFPGGAPAAGYLVSEAASYLPTANAFTISFWLYLNSRNVNYSNLITRSSSDFSWGNHGPVCIFMPPGSGVIRLRFGSLYEQDTSYEIPLNSWTLISLTYDGSTFNLYANGNVVKTYSYGGFGWNNWNNATGGKWYIGGHTDTIGSINGKIDDIRIEDVTRNPTYIQQQYQNVQNTSMLNSVGNSMSYGRHSHTVTRLNDGKMLIVGGLPSASGTTGIATAELYDPSTGMFSLTTNDLVRPRYNHTATLLSDGKVLIVGGQSTSSTAGDVTEAEIYDPSTNSFSVLSRAAFAQSTMVSTDSNTFINWKFDETPGATSWANTGSLGSGANLSQVGSSVSFVPGISGNAAQFTASSGSNLKTTGLTASSNPNQNQVTVSAWIYIKSYRGGWTGLVFKNYYADGTAPSPPYNGGIAIQLNPSNQFEIPCVFASASRQSVTATSSLNTWYLLTVTYDGSTIKFYVNGVLSGSIAQSGNLDWGSGQWIIGDTCATGETFGGIIDDVRIENTVRSSDYILNMYLNGIQTIPPSGRSEATATLLPNNKNVVIVGGSSGSSPTVSSTAEIYDSVSQKFRTISVPSATYRHRAEISSAGDLIIVGGHTGSAYNTTQLLNSSDIRNRVSGIDGYASSIKKLSSLTSADTATVPSFTDGYTVSMWVYLNSYTDNGILIGKKSSQNSNEFNPTGAGYSVLLKLTSGGNWQYISNGAAQTTTISTSPIPLKSWTLISMSNNGTTTTVYKNGVSVATVTETITMGSGAWSVGSNASSNFYGIDGVIDDVRLESTARSASYMFGLFGAASGFTRTISDMTYGRSGHALTKLKNGKVLVTGGETPGLISADGNTYIYWKLDETSGSFANTGAGSSLSLTATGSGFTRGQPGLAGSSSVYFNGTSGSYLSTGNTGVGPTGNKVTISVWIKLNNYTNYQSLICKYFNSNNSWSTPFAAFNLNVSDGGNGSLTSSVAYSATGNIWASKIGSVPLNTWTLISFTCDNGLCNYYQNGSLIYSASLPSGYTSINWGAGDWRIGGELTGVGGYLNGSVGDVRIENTVRSQDYIKELYNSGYSSNKAELYDPSTRTFTSTGNLVFSRKNHSATLINGGTYDGYVLVGGGQSGPTIADNVQPEIYDPTSGTFSRFSALKPIDSNTFINWKLDEASGTTSWVNSGTSNTSGSIGNLIAAGSAYSILNGISGNAVSFSGNSTTYLTSSGLGATNLPSSNNVTISCWVNVAAYPSSPVYPIIAAKVYDGLAQAPYFSAGFHIDCNNSQIFSMAYIGGTRQNLYWTTAPSLNTWYLLTMTYDGYSLKLYVNDNLVNSLAISGTINWGTKEWMIGGNQYATTNALTGIVDGVRIENTVRSQQYIKELYMSGVFGGGRSEQSTITLPNNNILVSGGKDSSSTLSTAFIYEPQTSTVQALNMNYTTQKHRTAITSAGDAVTIGGSDGAATLTYRPIQLLNSSESRTTTTGVDSYKAASLRTITSLYTKDTWAAPKSNNCTISLWVNLRSYKPNSILIAKKASSSTLEYDATGSGYGFVLKLTNDGYWQYASDQGLYGVTITDPTNKIALNTATLLSVTNNGTVTTLYKDGAAVATVNQPAINFGYGAWSVGSNASNSLYSLDGYIDEVRIENTCRNATYLSALRSAPATATDASTMINWKMEDVLGDNLLDDSGVNSGLPVADKDTLVFAKSNLQSNRSNATYTKLSNGKILITGGTANSDFAAGALNTADIYDPYTGIVSPTSNMNYARRRHAAALLQDGRVLIVGGVNDASSTSAEIYDPITNLFTVTNNMITARAFEPAVVTLNNGKVLVAGGYATSSDNYIGLAELYDPSTGTFSATGSMVTARNALVTMLLNNGKVLVAGGYGSSGPLNTCELYDPSSGTFAPSMLTMGYAKLLPSITELNDGKILISGGYNGSSATDTAQIFNPSNNTFENTAGNMVNIRWTHSSVKLPDGKVLLTGGYTNSSEIYDHSTKTFSSAAPMANARVSHGSFLLTSGKVAVMGGASNVVELYDVNAGTWTTNTTNYKFGTAISRENPEVVKLNDGRIFATGGFNGSCLNTTDVYSPSAGTSISGPTMSSARVGHFAAKLSNGNVLVGGGTSDGTAYLNTAQVYTPAAGAAGSFSTPAITFTTARAYAKAVTLNDGRVLVTGGHAGGNSIGTAEIYSSPSFGPTINMITARHSHTVTKLNDGYILVVGGATAANGNTSTASVELFNPTTNSFSSVGSLNKARYNHTATLLADGTVLIAGGQSSSTAGDVLDAEIYDPYTKTFKYAGLTGAYTNSTKLNTGRSEAQATLLPNNNVLISGGKNSSTILSSAEVYDVYRKTFTTVNMVNATYRHRAVLSDANDVVIIGGSNGAGTYQPVQLFASSLAATSGTGADGNAVSLSGSSAISSIDTLISPKSNEFTVSFFITLRNYTPNGIFVAKKYSSSSSELDPTGSGYAFVIKQTSSANGSWQFICNKGAVTVNSSSNISLNRITHIAVTTGAAGTKLYVDGGLVGSTSQVTVDFGSGPWSIGSNPSSTFYATNASLDEMRIESTQRDATYLAGLCNSRAGFILLGNTMNSPRWGHTITIAPNVYEPGIGNIVWTNDAGDNMLIIGGATNVNGTSATSSIDRAANFPNVGLSFQSAGNLSAPRYNHAAVLVSGYEYSLGYDGSIIVIGGITPGTPDSYPTTVEACHPRFSVGSKIAGNIQVPRAKCTATLLPNGNILITGGYNANGPVSTAEVFNLFTGTSTIVNMPYPTQKHRAILNNNKDVVLIGGSKDNSGTSASYLKTQLFNSSAMRGSVDGIYKRIPTSQEYNGSYSNYYGYMEYRAFFSGTPSSPSAPPIGANRVNKLTSMSTGNSPTLTPSANKFTISLWVYLTSYTSNALIIGKKSSSSTSENDIQATGYSIAIKQITNGNWQVIARNSSQTVTLNSDSVSKIPLNTWTLLSVTNNGFFTRAYINGIPACVPQNQSSVDFGTGPWAVASNPTDNTYAMDGYIDDVRIEDITRTAAYLRNLYKKTATPSASNIDLFEDDSLYARDLTPRGSSSPTINKGQSVSSGYSGVFNGTDGYVEFVPNFALNSSPWTIESWIYPRSLSSNYQTMLSRGSDWGLSINSTSLKFFTGATPTELTGTYSITNNAWHHVAASHDGNNLKLFVDGYQVASSAVSVVAGTSTGQATIGCKNNGSATEFFDGYMDDLRIIRNRSLYKSSFSVGGDGVIGNQVTLSCWIYPTSLNSSESGIVYKLLDNNSWSSTSASIAMGMSLGSNGTAYNYIRIDGNTFVNSIPNIRLNRWSLLTMTFDGSAKKFTSYLNDAQVATQTPTYLINGVPQSISGSIDWDSHGSWYVGSFPQQNSSFNGKVCEVRLENTARTLPDVKDLYNHVGKDLFGTYSPSDLILAKEDLKKYSWFTLESKSSTKRYLCLQRGETLDKWRIKYSTSLPSTTNASFDITPAATSLNDSIIYGGGTDLVPTFSSMFAGLTENQYVAQMGADDGYNSFFFFAYNKGEIASMSHARTMFVLDQLPDYSGSRKILGVYPQFDADSTVVGVLNNKTSSYNNIKYSSYSSDYSSNTFHRLKGFVSKGISGKQNLVNIAVASWGPIITFNGVDGYDGYAWSPSFSQVKNPHTDRFGLLPANYFYKNNVATSDTNQSYKGSSNMIHTAAVSSSVKLWDKFSVSSTGDKILVNGFVLPWNNDSLQDS